MAGSYDDTDAIRAAVDQAIQDGRTADLDVVVRARYAYAFGAGDSLHRDLADEVERLRAILATADLLPPPAAR